MTRTARHWLVPVALVVLVALAGCSGGASDAAQKATAGAGDPPAEASNDEAAATDGDTEYQRQNAQTRQRAIVRTGTVSLTVEDYDSARQRLTQRTRRLGGFVSDSAEQVHTRDNQSWTTGRVVLRVPKRNFSVLFSAAKGTGEVQKASTSSTDVTDKLVDLEARLKNLRAQRDRLREMYQNANDTENVLAVQERLSEVQTEIERLEAKQKSLERRVAYSTITVHLNESPPDRERPEHDPKQWYETGLLAAFVSSVHALEVVARSLAVGLAYAIPFVLAFGIPIGGVAVWRRRRSDSTGGTDLPEVPEESDERDVPEEESE